MGSGTLILLMAMSSLIVYVVMAYNRLVRLEQNVKAAWSNIDVLLKQRHDELPKLVTTCREQMQHEQETLEKVSLARAQVLNAIGSGDIVELGVAESLMSNALERLFALTENYPELQGDESFLRLQIRISSLDNAIADRREYYNNSVNINNIVVEEFPTNIVAGQFKFDRADLFKVNEQEPGDVKLEALFAA